MNVVVSWSGGKDSALAYYKALLKGLKPSCLLTLVSRGSKATPHGLNSEIMVAQSKALGIPIMVRESTWETYEEVFKESLKRLRKLKNVEGVVFGDIYVQEHIEWAFRVCEEVGLTPLEPLWGLSHEEVLKELVSLGFEAIFVNVKADIFGEEWLGRKIDQSVIGELKRLQSMCNLDICGELGEYHTLVVDGPTFNKKLKILECGKTLREGYWRYWLLEVYKYQLEEKDVVPQSKR